MIQGGTKSGRKFEIQFLSIILVDKFRRRLTLHRPNFPPLFPPSISKLFITFFVFTIKIFETRNLYIYIYIQIHEIYFFIILFFIIDYIILFIVSNFYNRPKYLQLSPIEHAQRFHTPTLYSSRDKNFGNGKIDGGSETKRMVEKNGARKIS